LRADDEGCCAGSDRFAIPPRARPAIRANEDTFRCIDHDPDDGAMHIARCAVRLDPHFLLITQARQRIGVEGRFSHAAPA